MARLEDYSTHITTYIFSFADFLQTFLQHAIHKVLCLLHLVGVAVGVNLHGGVDVGVTKPELAGLHGHVSAIQQRGAVVAQLVGGDVHGPVGLTLAVIGLVFVRFVRKAQLFAVGQPPFAVLAGG